MPSQVLATSSSQTIVPSSHGTPVVPLLVPPELVPVVVVVEVPGPVVSPLAWVVPLVLGSPLLAVFTSVALTSPVVAPVAEVLVPALVASPVVGRPVVGSSVGDVAMPVDPVRPVAVVLPPEEAVPSSLQAASSSAIEARGNPVRRCITPCNNPAAT